MWGQYPKHLLEIKRKVPYIDLEMDPAEEIKEKKVRPHILTQYARKKFHIPEYNK
jgi:hypothetical protein